MNLKSKALGLCALCMSPTFFLSNVAAAAFPGKGIEGSNNETSPKSQTSANNLPANMEGTLDSESSLQGTGNSATEFNLQGTRNPVPDPSSPGTGNSASPSQRSSEKTKPCDNKVCRHRSDPIPISPRHYDYSSILDNDNKTISEQAQASSSQSDDDNSIGNKSHSTDYPPSSSKHSRYTFTSRTNSTPTQSSDCNLSSANKLIKQLQEKLTKAEQKSKQLKEELNKTKQEFDNQKTELDKTKIESKQQEAQIEILNKELSETQAELNELKNKQKDQEFQSKSEITKLQIEHAKQTFNLETQIRENKLQQEEQVHEIEKEMKKRLDEMQKQLDEMKKQLDKKQKQLDEQQEISKKALSDEQNESKRKEDKIKDLEEKCSSAEERLENLKYQKEIADRTIEKISNQNSMLSDEILMLNETIEQMTSSSFYSIENSNVQIQGTDNDNDPKEADNDDIEEIDYSKPIPLSLLKRNTDKFLKDRGWSDPKITGFFKKALISKDFSSGTTVTGGSMLLFHVTMKRCKTSPFDKGLSLFAVSNNPFKSRDTITCDDLSLIALGTHSSTPKTYKIVFGIDGTPEEITLTDKQS